MGKRSYFRSHLKRSFKRSILFVEVEREFIEVTEDTFQEKLRENYPYLFTGIGFTIEQRYGLNNTFSVC